MDNKTYDKIRLAALTIRNHSSFTDIPTYCDFINRDLYIILKMSKIDAQYHKGTFKTDQPMEYMYPDLFEQDEISAVKFFDAESKLEFPHYFITVGEHIVDAACYQFNRCLDRKYRVPAINITTDKSRYKILKNIVMPKDQIDLYCKKAEQIMAKAENK